MPFIFNNRAVSHLAQAINSSATQIKIDAKDYELFNRLGAGADDFMFCVLRGPEDREIVKIIPDQGAYPPAANTFLKCERGQGGTAAEDWPAGTLIFLSTVADHYSEIVQRGNIRQVDYNPNGVLSPLFHGEEILQYAGCEIRWWKSIDATNPYWHLIAGEPCGTEEFVNPTGDYISSVWIQFVLGEFFLRDSVFDASQFYSAINHNGFVLAGCDFSNGLQSYSIDGSGNLTAIDTDTQGGNYSYLASNGTYVVVAQTNFGLLSYAVDGGGNLTFIDEATDPSDTRSVIWRSPHFISGAGNGIFVHTLDGSGFFSLVNSGNPGGPAPGKPYHVAWDGNFLYSASFADGGAGGGLRSYSVDGAGNISFIDFDNLFDPFIGNFSYWDCHSDGTFILCAIGSSGVLVYQVDGSGNLTYKSQKSGLGFCNQVTKHNDFWVVSTLANGMYSFSLDEGTGALTQKDNEPIGQVRKVTSYDETFLLVPNNGTGFKTYELV